MKYSCQQKCTLHTHTFTVTYTNSWTIRDLFSHSRVSRRRPWTLLLISSFYENTRNQKNFCCSHKNPDSYSADVHKYTYNKNRHAHTQRLVSIFSASSGIWGLNLEGHFVKQIQHQRVGRLSKHAGHVFPSVCVFYVCRFIFFWTLHVPVRLF